MEWYYYEFSHMAGRDICYFISHFSKSVYVLQNSVEFSEYILSCLLELLIRPSMYFHAK